MHSPTVPIYGTRAYPGLRPKIPQYPDGIRILPPTSEPTPSAAPSAASSAPSPPEEPPGVWAADHGLHVRPQRGLQLSKARSVCGTFVLAKMTAPAARSVETTYTVWRVGKSRVCRLWKAWQNETYGGVLFGWLIGPLCIPYRTIEPLHVDYPHLVNNLEKKGVGENVHWSFTLIGTPCSGPFKRPVAANSSSNLRASCLASSKNTIRRVRRTRTQHYHYDRVQIVETQAVRTFSEVQFIASCTCAARAI